MEYQKVLTAMESNPGSVCLRLKFSSSNVFKPYIHVLPVPSPLRKSPPWHMKSLICSAGLLVMSFDRGCVLSSFRRWQARKAKYWHLSTARKKIVKYSQYDGTCFLCILEVFLNGSSSRQYRTVWSSPQFWGPHLRRARTVFCLEAHLQQVSLITTMFSLDSVPAWQLACLCSWLNATTEYTWCHVMDNIWHTSKCDVEENAIQQLASYQQGLAT